MVGGSLGYVRAFFLFFVVGILLVPSGYAYRTPESNCPQMLHAKRAIATLEANPEWDIEQSLRFVYDTLTLEANELIPPIETAIQEAKVRVGNPFIETEERAAIAKEIEKLTQALEGAKAMAEPVNAFGRDLEILKDFSVGDILTYLIPVVHPNELEAEGFTMSTPELSRALMTIAVHKANTPQRIHYIPATRESKPSESVKQKMIALLTLIGGVAPTEHLLKRLWHMPLVRESLYSSKWGRLEMYWELLQRNPKLDPADYYELRKVALLIDRLEELLLRPAPTKN